MIDKHKKSNGFKSLLSRLSTSHSTSSNNNGGLHTQSIKKRQNQQRQDVKGYNCGFTPEYMIRQHGYAHSISGGIPGSSIFSNNIDSSSMKENQDFEYKSTKDRDNFHTYDIRRKPLNFGNDISNRLPNTISNGFSLSKSSGKLIRHIIGGKRSLENESQSTPESNSENNSSCNSSISLLTGGQFKKFIGYSNNRNNNNKSQPSKLLSDISQCSPTKGQISDNKPIEFCKLNQFSKDKSLAYDNKENTDFSTVIGTDVVSISNNEYNKSIQSGSVIFTKSKANSGFVVHDASRYSALYVGDLDLNCTVELLSSTFGIFKGFVSAKIPLDNKTGKSMGYGYVNFLTKENATVAMRALNYNVILNSEIRIMHSIRDKSKRAILGCNIYLANLPDLLTTRALYDRLSKYGEILSCKLNRDNNSAYVLFDTREDALNAIKSMDGCYWGLNSISAFVYNPKREDRKIENNETIDNLILPPRFEQSESPIDTISLERHTASTGRGIYFGSSIFASSTEVSKFKAPALESSLPMANLIAVKQVAKPERTQFSLFIKNLPISITNDAIRVLVSPYGKVMGIRSDHNEKLCASWALVVMKDEESLIRAINGLNELEINGRLIRVVRGIPKSRKVPLQLRELQGKYNSYTYKVLIGTFKAAIYQDEVARWRKDFRTLKKVHLFEKNPDSHNNRIVYGIAEFSNTSQCQFYMLRLKGLGIESFQVRVEYKNATRRILMPEDYPLDPRRVQRLSAFSKRVRQDRLKSELAVAISACSTKSPMLKKDIGSPSLPAIPPNVQQSGKESVHRKAISIPIKSEIEYHLKILLREMYGDAFEFSKSQIHSVSTNMIKSYWGGDEIRLASYIKENGMIGSQVNPIFRLQILQTTTYLEIIPKFRWSKAVTISI